MQRPEVLNEPDVSGDLAEACAVVVGAGLATESLKSHATKWRLTTWGGCMQRPLKPHTGVFMIE